ncbi:MAG TPA: BNR-4 repeat-containing protein [Microthrixaceae bacterium]|nr:BNR-4 repeat-containing protein [Microthrixaceae bacterium]
MVRTRRKAIALLSVIILVVAACEFEAELPKEVSGDVEFLDEESASNGQFARIGPYGSTSYEFSPNPNYQSSPQIIWVRTRCAAGPSASLEVTVDGGAPVAWPDPCVPDDAGPDPAGWSWTRVSSPTATPATFNMTAPGAHEVGFTGTGGDVDIDKVWVGPVGSGSPTGKGLYGKGIEKVTIEAESADPVAGWTQFADPEARGGAALKSTAGQFLLEEPEFGPETITLETTVPRAGTYTFWARGIRPGTFTGQMWVRVNGGTAQRVGIGPAGQWTWSRLSRISPSERAKFELVEGPATIEIRAAAPGFSLDQLVLTNGKYYLPSLAQVQDPFADVWPAGGEFDLVTQGNHQYVAYYNKDARITVAHRQLNQAAWQKKTLGDARALFTKAGGFDTHNYLTMAVDGAGNLHVAGNMHVEPMTYYRTTVPHDITTLAPGAMPDAEPGRTTYPVFIESADPGELFIKYRGGTSGDGEEYINRYDVSTGQWAPLRLKSTPAGDVQVPLLAACANCQWVGLSCPTTPCQREYAYNKILFDGTKYHLVWIWRTWDPSNHTNVISSHDISYAWSYDLRDWFLASDTTGANPLQWPLSFDGPKGYSDRAAPVLDPPQDPKVIEWLPPGTGDSDHSVAMRLGGGLHNSHFEISVMPSGDPVVSYSKFVYRLNNGVTEVDSVVVNARLNAGQWQRHVLTAGTPCPQTTTPGEVGPTGRASPGRLVVERDGSVSEQVRTCGSIFPTNYRLDAAAAFSTARQYPQYSLVPAEIKELEADRSRRDFCGDATAPDPEQQDEFDTALDSAANPTTVLGHGEASGGRQFFLRWNRLPSVDFGRPNYCQADPLVPSQLRIYEASP